MSKLSIKPNQKVLLKTYELHEGWVGGVEATFLGWLSEDEALVVVDFDYFGEKRKTLWKTRISDIIGVKNE